MSAKLTIHPTVRKAAAKIKSTLPAREIENIIEGECGVSTLHSLIKLSTANGLKWVEKMQKSAEEIEKDFDRLFPDVARPRPMGRNGR